MNDETVIRLEGGAANDNGRETRSIKSLLCDGCGRCEAVLDGLCGPCFADAETLLNDRRGGDEWMTP